MNKNKQHNKFERKFSKHKRFLANRRSIHKALDFCLSHRFIGVRARDICKIAHITSPTFYSHYHNINNALRAYEHILENDFMKSLPQTRQKEVIFTFLLSYILEYKSYFRVTLSNNDFYLLSRLLNYLRPQLVGTRISNLNFATYRGQVLGLIYFWAINENFSADKIPRYAKMLALLRPIALNN